MFLIYNTIESLGDKYKKFKMLYYVFNIHHLSLVLETFYKWNQSLMLTKNALICWKWQ